MAQVVAGEQRRGHKVMVFCNTLDSCRAADKHLQEQGVPSLTYHGDVPLDGRRQAIQQFAQGGQTEPAQRSSASGSSQPVLVCTDLAARSALLPICCKPREDLLLCHSAHHVCQGGKHKAPPSAKWSASPVLHWACCQGSAVNRLVAAQAVLHLTRGEFNPEVLHENSFCDSRQLLLVCTALTAS